MASGISYSSSDPEGLDSSRDMARISSERPSHSLMEPGEQRELSSITKFLLIV